MIPEKLWKPISECPKTGVVLVRWKFNSETWLYEIYVAARALRLSHSNNFGDVQYIELKEKV